MLNRRTFIGAGAAAGLLALPRPIVAATVAPYHGQIDPRLRARALLALAAKRPFVRYADVIGIADFNRPSREPRFHILDLRSGQVTSHYVAHGRGSDPGHSGWLNYFSNVPGSEATSEGAYVTGDAYVGKYGHSLRVTGLDPTNSNAEARAIVVHSAWYAEPEVIRQNGKLGRSEGCFATPGVSHAEIMTRLGSGRLIYADKV